MNAYLVSANSGYSEWSNMSWRLWCEYTTYTYDNTFRNMTILQTEASPEGKLMVGLTGYPNVGKSSTINALFGSKKTTVSATPGKTKHFQTLNITPQLSLVDCPGLVLPRYAASKAEMVAAGWCSDLSSPFKVPCISNFPYWILVYFIDFLLKSGLHYYCSICIICNNDLLFNHWECSKLGDTTTDDQ